ncbi:MAG: hypothetical protein AB1505_27875 [Candidatus Latescibacterota bacterium]
MDELRIACEWQEAPDVRSPALATTWARIEIAVGDRPLTRFWSTTANAGRTAVYSSALPLACWIGRNWWSLLYEALPAPEMLMGARRAGPRHRGWLERHNLLFSREGMAYPDLSIYREDDLVSLRWVVDTGAVTTPGRFVDEGSAQLVLAAAESLLASLVEGVLERVEHVSEPSVDQLREDWTAVRSAAGEERELCTRLAALGADPYASDLESDLEDLLWGPLPLEDAVLRDLLAATTRGGLEQDLDATRRLEEKLPAVQGQGGETRPVASPYDPLPCPTSTGAS